MKQIKALGIPKIKALGLGSTAELGSKKEDDTEVIVIELVDKLDDGSKNDGNNKGLETTIQKGLLFGISSAASCLLNVGSVGSCSLAANMP